MLVFVQVWQDQVVMLEAKYGEIRSALERVAAGGEDSQDTNMDKKMIK